MKALLHGNNVIAVLFPSVIEDLSCQLYCCLISFCSTVAEKNLVGKRVGYQQFCQSNLRLAIEKVGNVHELFTLLVNSFNDVGMKMAYVQDRYS